MKEKIVLLHGKLKEIENCKTEEVEKCIISSIEYSTSSQPLNSTGKSPPAASFVGTKRNSATSWEGGGEPAFTTSC